MPDIEDTEVSINETQPLKEPKTNGSSNFAKRIWQAITIFSLYISNFGVVVCRSAVDVVLPSLQEDLGYNETQLGALLAFGSAGYFCGSMISGYTADKIGGKQMMMITVLTTAIMTTTLGWISQYWIMCIFMFFDKMMMSGSWPAMTNVISKWFEKKSFGKVFGVLSTASRLGAIFANLALGGLMSIGVHWRGAMFTSAAILNFILILIAVLLRNSPKDVGLKEMEKDEDKIPHRLDKTTIWNALWIFAKSVRFWLLIISSMCTSSIMELQSFLPLYLKNSQNLTPGIASTLSVTFGIGCAISVLIGGTIYDRLGPISKFIFMTILMILCTVGCAVLGIFQTSLTVVLCMIFLIGIAISPCFYLPVTFFAMNFAGKWNGTMINLLDGIGLLAGIVYDLVGGILAEYLGWNTFFGLTAVVSILGTITLSLFMYLQNLHDRGLEPICD